MLGNTTRYRYDFLGNLLEEILPEQEKKGQRGTRYRYDALDRMIMQETPGGNLYLYEYGNEDCLALSIHPNAAAEGRKEGIRHDYDTDNRRIRTHYPDGGCERYFYDANGNLTKMVKPGSYDPDRDDGEGYIYAYDCMDRLTMVTNPLGETEAEYLYDGAGNMINCQDMLSPEYGLHKYNHAGWHTEWRMPVIKDEYGNTLYRLTTYKYDKMGNLIEEKRYLDYQSEESEVGSTNNIYYSYDSYNRILCIKDKTGASIEYFYNRLGYKEKELHKICEDKYKEIRFIHDASGRLLKHCVKLENSANYTGKIPYAITEYKYDANGNITETVMPEGGVIAHVYDNDNRVIKELHKEIKGEIDNCMFYEYDHAGNMVIRRTIRGDEKRYTYDYMNRETSYTNQDGGTGRKEYDQNGRLLREILPCENEIKGKYACGYLYEYDKADRRTATIAPDGTILNRRILDKNGNVTELIEGENLSGNSTNRYSTKYDYDLAGRVTVITTPEGIIQKFDYDASGNLIKTTDGMGNATRFIVDAWGRITTVKNADGSCENYTYDHAGNMTGTTDGEGHTTVYSYNCRNLQESRTDASGNSDYFIYDREGNLAAHTDRQKR